MRDVDDGKCPVIGRDRCRKALEAEFPSQPVLLLGPESTGKWKLARWIGDIHAAWFNQLVLETCGIDDIRAMRSSFLATGPRPVSSGPSGLKVVQVNLDGARSSSVQHALLKELEEPPGYSRFILTASRSPLPTVSSRCLIWRLGRLEDGQVAEILVSLGVSQKDAESLAPIGGGRVRPALEAAERFRPAKALVLALLRSISSRDRELLERTAVGWGDTEDWMLRELLGSAASGRPSAVFSSSERQAIGRTAARRGIALLSACGSARPRIAVRSMAVDLMEER